MPTEKMAFRRSARVEVFAGIHEWPPEPFVAQALGWMELQAMKRGTRAKSPEIIAALWGEDLARARALEAEGKPVEAVRAYDSLITGFAGLRDAKDLAEAARRRAALEMSAAFQRESRERQERDRRDREYLERVPSILNGALSPAQALADLTIPELKRRAGGLGEGATDPAEKLSAERLLNAVYVQAGFHLPREAAERQQFDRAIFDLQIAGEIEPEVPHVPFRLAVAWAQKGNRPKALEALAGGREGVDRPRRPGERALLRPAPSDRGVQEDRGRVAAAAAVAVIRDDPESSYSRNGSSVPTENMASRS